MRFRLGLASGSFDSSANLLRSGSLRRMIATFRASLLATILNDANCQLSSNLRESRWLQVACALPLSSLARSRFSGRCWSSSWNPASPIGSSFFLPGFGLLLFLRHFSSHLHPRSAVLRTRSRQTNLPAQRNENNIVNGFRHLAGKESSWMMSSRAGQQMGRNFSEALIPSVKEVSNERACKIV